MAVLSLFEMAKQCDSCDVWAMPMQFCALHNPDVSERELLLLHTFAHHLCMRRESATRQRRAGTGDGEPVTASIHRVLRLFKKEPIETWLQRRIHNGIAIADLLAPKTHDEGMRESDEVIEYLGMSHCPHKHNNRREGGMHAHTETR